MLREIVHAAIGAGARLAEPGEFTFRAYLGGRIDLVQAKAVGDLVDAVNTLQARVASTNSKEPDAIDRVTGRAAVRSGGQARSID